ncbi:MAG: hypothetical protein ACO1SX_27175 [Actinomycetota bacterium]
MRSPFQWMRRGWRRQTRRQRRLARLWPWQRVGWNAEWRLAKSGVSVKVAK